MVNKRDASAPAPEAVVPKLAPFVAADDLVLPANLTFSEWDNALAGAPHRFGQFKVGEKIDHVDGMTVEEAEHQTVTRLYQNTAKVHFDGLAQQSSRFGKRLIYGGVAISTARSLAFNGLANAAWVLALNAGRHVNPLFAGDTVYAWSEVLDAVELNERASALRLRLVATKNRPCADHPYKKDDGEYDPAVILDLDYWAAIPR